MTEILTVLNKNGRVIGSADRNEVHKKGLWHKGVHILVYNEINEFVLPIRSKKKADFPNCYDVSVSEHVKKGENYLRAAKRGLQEELSITNAKLVPCVEFKMEYGINDNHFARVYLCENHGGIQINRAEIKKATLVDLATLKLLLLNEPEKFASWTAEIFKWFLNISSQINIIMQFRTRNDLIRNCNALWGYGADE